MPQHTTLLHRANLSWLPSDAEIIQPAPRQRPTYHSVPSSSSQPSSHDYDQVQAILRFTQEEQASLRTYVTTKQVALCDFAQERHDELRGMIAS